MFKFDNEEKEKTSGTRITGVHVDAQVLKTYMHQLILNFNECNSKLIMFLNETKHLVVYIKWTAVGGLTNLQNWTD